MACRNRLLQLVVALTGLSAALACNGCGAGDTITGGGAQSLHITGTVMGQQQPVSGAKVQLFAAGTGGNGTAACNLTGNGACTSANYVTTLSDGSFSLAGDFTCPTSSGNYVPQLYVLVTGGNPGLGGNVNNPALAMIDAVGPCSNLNGSDTLYVNEVTTAAAAYALAGFATSPTNIASSATNAAGIANAFLNAQLLADPHVGTSPGTLPSGNTIESGKLYALADVLATCVNSDGVTPVNGSYSACQNLYTTTGQCTSACTSDSFSAALYIVKHPGQNVANTFGLIPPNAGYATTLTLAPHDWTMSMTITGGGIASPTELGIDTAGNAWVADYAGGVSAFSPQGSPLTGSPFATAGLGEIYGFTVDTNNNAWAAIEENPNNGTSGTGSMVGLYGITSGHTLGSALTNFTNAYVYYPEELASGPNGTVIIGNDAGFGWTNTFTYSGTTPTFGLTYGGYGYSPNATDVAGDLNGGTWMANTGSTTVTHVDASRNLISNSNCCNEPQGVATDSAGNAWVTNYGNASLTKLAPGCDTNAYSSASCYSSESSSVILVNQQTGGGLYYPSKVALDAAQNVWVVNYRGQSFSEFSDAGTPVSPASIYTNGAVTTQGGYGLDANLLTPYDLVPDASGNLWVSNNGNNNLVVFFGLATPTATPKLPTPTAP